MDYEKIAEKIKKAMDNNPDSYEVQSDYLDLLLSWVKDDKTAAQLASRERRDECVRAMRRAARAGKEVANNFSELYFRHLLFTAQDYFEDFMRAIDYGKPASKQFFVPRQHYLKPIVQGYQDIIDGKLHLLTVSMPKRSGKSQTEILATLMMSGKKPNGSTLMEGTGDALVDSFYKGLLEYVQLPNEYNFYSIFPDRKLVQTNADTKIFNLDKKSRFPTVMCRSIDSRQVGLSEATNMLILDDCVEGREEAKNRARLDDKWEVISGDILGRAIEGTPIIATGTRYSLYDPIGHLQEEATKLGWKWRAIEIPALDPVTDESNYEYVREGHKVFTTQYFREQRELLSAEQWESEFQQQPFEAKGLMFPPNLLNYFYELPVDVEPDAIVAVCDTADVGSDFCSMPIAAVYGTDVYITDVVFDDSAPEVTKPEVAKALKDNRVSTATFESNNAGAYFARDVDAILKLQGVKCSIRTKRTISNKQTRMEFASDGIIKNFYFKAVGTYERGSQYDMFMRQVTTHTRQGKVAHDDAPDSLALLENELRMTLGAALEVFRRPW